MCRNLYLGLMKLYISSIALVLLSLSGFGQSLVSNQVKYWDNRERLVTEFMVLGQAPGNSLPARGKIDSIDWIYWADATINLSWYMGVLATEYHLLSTEGMPRTESEHVVKINHTLEEIYYTLAAINRLDSMAEPFFEPKRAPELNGFFLRDDVPKSMIKGLPNKHHMRSDYEATKKTDNEESQDQAHHLMMGLMCIYRFVPDDVSYQGVAIAAYAKETALRIIDWQRDNGWKIVNPAKTNSNGKALKVERGPESYIYSSGTMKIRRQFETANKSLGEKPVKAKLNPLNRLFWSSLRMGINPNYVKADNKHMSMTLIATGNGFKRVTYRKLLKKSFNHEWYFYPLLNATLYPDNKRHRKDEELMVETRRLLDLAPAEGCNSHDPNTAKTGWSVNNRFMRKSDVNYSLPKNGEGRSFASLDYMLLHNLYLIQRNQVLPAKKGYKY